MVQIHLQMGFNKEKKQEIKMAKSRRKLGETNLSHPVFDRPYRNWFRPAPRLSSPPHSGVGGFCAMDAGPLVEWMRFDVLGSVVVGW